MKGLIGSSVLSLPFGFAAGSLIPSIGCLIFSLGVSLYAGIIITQSCVETHRFQLNCVFQTEKIKPPWDNILTSFCLVICVINSMITCASYVTVASDTISYFVTDVRHIYWKLMATYLVYFPLCLIDLSDLWCTSFLGLLSMLFTLGVLYFSDSTVDPAQEELEFCAWAPSWNIVSVLGICIQAFVLQYSIPPMYSTLKSRKIDEFIGCLWVAHILTFWVYLAFGYLGYKRFGASVEGDVLLDLSDGLSGGMARLFVCMSIIGSYPLMITGTVNTIQGQFFRSKNTTFSVIVQVVGLMHVQNCSSSVGWVEKSLFIWTCVTICLIISIIIKDFGMLIAYNGVIGLIF
eukprot:UN25280